MFAFLVSCGSTKANQQPGNPAVFSINAEALKKNRKRIQANDPVIMPSYKLLIWDFYICIYRGSEGQKSFGEHFNILAISLRWFTL